METHQLRYFDLVVREGSYTRAAERAHVSQSGLSTQVAKLERELGCQLLHRGRHGASLTSAGETIYPVVQRTLRGLDEIAATAADLRDLVVGSVELSVIIGCTMPFIVDGLAAFRAAHEGVAVELREASSDDMLRDLSRGRLDLALVGHVGTLPDDLVGVLVADDPVVALYPPTSTPPKTTTLKRLAVEDTITLPAGTGVRAALDQAAAAAGIALNPTYEVHSADMLLALVNAGAGVGIISRGMLAGSPLVHTPIGGRGLTSQLSLAHRHDISPAAARLRDTLVLPR